MTEHKQKRSTVSGVQKALVSVIVPAYNSAHIIRDALNSVYAQTHRPIELLVVNDGSLDDTAKVIKNWKKEHPDTKDFTTQLVEQENKGAPAARNLGLQKSTGEFIQFLDADDLLKSEKITTQLNHPVSLTKEAITFCDGEIFNGIDKTFIRTVTHVRSWRNETDPFLYLAIRNIETPAPLHYKSFLVKINGFNEKLSCAQEFDLHLRMAAHGIKFMHVPKTLYRVRKMPNSVGSNPVRVMQQHRITFESVKQILTEKRALTKERSKAMAKLLAVDASKYLLRRHVRDAVSSLNQARKLHPNGIIGSSLFFVYFMLLGMIGNKGRIMGSSLKQKLLRLIKRRKKVFFKQ